VSESAVRLLHYIAGEWLAPGNTTWTPDVNPSDARQVLAYVPQGQPEIIDRAVESAQNAFAGWGRASGPERMVALHRVANKLVEVRDALATLVALEVGKPIGEAEQEVDRGVMILRYFAEEAVRPIGAVIPAQLAGSLQFSLRQPIGPLAVISPWNFPIAIPLWKIAPALAYGNTIIWKPAETASLVATRLVEVFAAAGLPEGVLNLALGKGSATGSALTGHPGIRAITFTGSETVGMEIAESAARRNIKYQLEMGGKNAVIVLADAALHQAAQLVAAGAMRFAGQKCTATSRVIVAAEVADDFFERLVEQIHLLPLAPASERRSAVGPLIAPEALVKVSSYAEIGSKAGKVLVGGHAVTGELFNHGYFFEPTVIVDVPSDSRAAQEEIFGPLLIAQRARSIEEALALANSTKYGLSVSLFTRDINSALRYIQDIECGMVRVNGDTTGVDPHAPFGGMKASSSHSREQGPAAIEFFTELKTVQINPAAGR
jgi:aldehyde dehydrogenase (NAD+)